MVRTYPPTPTDRPADVGPGCARGSCQEGLVGVLDAVLGRLAGRGIVTVTKDAAGKNAACVQLTPRGELLFGQVLALRFPPRP
jgi:hypothetical protein